MKTLLLLVGILASASAFASHYGPSGCGLGSQVFKTHNDIATQVLSATTNGTSYNQTFGITSGTSNCVDHGTVAKNKEVPLFVEANQVALANDIARGKGETLANFSKVLGCQDQAQLGNTLQKNYSKIFTNENIQNSQVTGSLLNTVKDDAVLARSCENLI